MGDKQKIAVIGAGPKGVAIAAKASVLSQLEILDIEVELFDEHGVAANWDGTCGYTDGQQKLGTPPEKDIGFPWASVFGGETAKRLYEYSWPSYLVASGRFARYVDRGKPHPTHSEWAAYLRWVASSIEAHVRRERVVEVGPARNGAFYVESIRDKKRERTYFHGIVLTGPGKPLKVWGSDHEWNENIVDGRVFWQRLAVFNQLAEGRVAIIGAGETAASIAVALVQRAPKVTIDIINRHATLYTRGESYHENELYTDPTRWHELDEADREEFIRRTDRGVFSVEAKKTIDHASNIRILTGNVTALEQNGRVVDVEVERAGRTRRYAYEKVVVAIGFDALSALEVLSPNISTHVPRGDIAKRLELFRAVRRRVDFHFRVPIPFNKAADEPLSNLHVPNLGALMQGPGFPNLSCLGALSDRVLTAYSEHSAKKDWYCQRSTDDSGESASVAADRMKQMP